MNKDLIYKVLRIIAGVIIGLILLVISALYYVFSNICDEELMGTYKSPNGAHEAVYSAKRCGAISEDVGSIALDGKEVVRVRLGDLSTYWIDNESLHVEYSGIKIAKLLREYRGVKVDFTKIPTKIIPDTWSVNTGTYEGKPMILRIRNVSEEALALIAKIYQYQVGITIPLVNPDDNGFPSASESEQLLTIEDEIVSVIEKSEESIYVATITTSGMREFVFYTSNPDGIKSNFEIFEDNIKTHKPQIIVQKDTEWGIYRALSSSVKK